MQIAETAGQRERIGVLSCVFFSRIIFGKFYSLFISADRTGWRAKRRWENRIGKMNEILGVGILAHNFIKPSGCGC